MHEPAIGQYEYHVTGEVAAPLTLDLMSGRIHGLIELGRVKAVCLLNAKGDLEGRWTSEFGTEGTITATRFEKGKITDELPKNTSVFVVHGQAAATKDRTSTRLNSSPSTVQR